jgi:transcriptional regulator GlxA family with amidase domain
MNRLADILLIEVIRAHIASSDCPEHGLRALNDPLIASALALIHRHPEEPWTIERLANAVALQHARRRTTRGLPRSLADDQGR